MKKYYQPKIPQSETAEQEYPWDHIDSSTGERILIIPDLRRGHGIVRMTVPADGVLPMVALTDYLNMTFAVAPDFDVDQFLAELLELLGERFYPPFFRERGLHGYEDSYALGNVGALFAIGGQSSTGFLSLSGESCLFVDDWQVLHDFLSGLPAARVTRWDGAVDDFIGRFGVTTAVRMYKQQLFHSGGNKPSCRQIGNWLEADGRGRTFYVGQRQNGKMLRVYEKGMQCGRRFHPWVRWEVELRSKDRVIPWDVLLRPGPYFVASYPKALGWANKELERIHTIKVQHDTTLDAMAENAKKSYGKTIWALREFYGGDCDKVVERLVRYGPPERLENLHELNVGSPSDERPDENA